MPFGFTPVDIVFCVIILILCIRASIKGLIDEFFGLGTFIFGAYLAYRFMHLLKPYLAACMNDTIAAILSFILIFVAIFLIIKIIQLALKSIFSGSILKSLDHGLGFFFGAAEGIFLVVLIIIGMKMFNNYFDTTAIRESSVLCRFLSSLVNSAGNILEKV
ncbi:MAG: CvpA family protein [Treponema sp.]|nr:CvpA family protein [Candidatus Treponema merdequi]